MKLTWDRRYEDRWEYLKDTYARCERCMEDAPYSWCCKHQCGKLEYCNDCHAECREGNKLCVK